MAYSTVTQIRNNDSKLNDTDRISDAVITDRISIADKHVETDLSNIINFSAIVVTPDFINLLSQYKATEMSLVYLYGAIRKASEKDDIVYWSEAYNNMLDDIKSGRIELVDGSDPAVSIALGPQTFTNEAKNNIEPALGTGKFMGWQTKDDLENERPINA